MINWKLELHFSCLEKSGQEKGRHPLSGIDVPGWYQCIIILSSCITNFYPSQLSFGPGYRVIPFGSIDGIVMGWTSFSLSLSVYGIWLCMYIYIYIIYMYCICAYLSVMHIFFSIFFSDLRGDGNVLNPKAYRNNKYHKPSPPMPHKKLGGSNVAVALPPTLVYNCNNSGLWMFMVDILWYIN